MITLLKVIASAFELFNKIATRFREVRIERAIKKKMSSEAREGLGEDEKEVLDQLKKKYGNRRSDDF